MFSMYYLIRYIIWFIVFSIIYELLGKKRIENKERLVFIICIIGWFVSIFLNIESVFLKFETPEKAYNYIKGNKNISLIIDAKNSSLLVAKDGNVEILLKEKNKWKIRYNFYSKLIPLNKYYSNITISMYNYNNNYYIKILDKNNDSIIRDNKNTEFIKKSNNNQVIYYGYINNYEDDYILFVNEEEYKINNQN